MVVKNPAIHSVNYPEPLSYACRGELRQGTGEFYPIIAVARFQAVRCSSGSSLVSGRTWRSLVGKMSAVGAGDVFMGWALSRYGPESGADATRVAERGCLILPQAESSQSYRGLCELSIEQSSGVPEGSQALKRLHARIALVRFSQTRRCLHIARKRARC